MKNDLLRDTLVVFVTWFVIAYAWSRFPVTLLPQVIMGVMLIWAIGLAAGIASSWFRSEGGLVATRVQLGRLSRSGGEWAQARIMDADRSHTLYSVPLPIYDEPEKGAQKGNPLHRLPWWKEYAQANPHHARALNDAFAVMQSKPGIPASPAGGHGGLSLVDHSMNVLNSMLKLAPEWRFKGVLNKSGKVVVPLSNGRDELRILDPTPLGCPILPLLAFAHDIGKVSCYTVRNGKVESVIGGHGERGAALLRRLDSVMQLPMEDRDALLLGVEFYHHLSDMPTARWISDRIRSLTALLYVADCDASDAEGDSDKDAAEARALYLPHATPSQPESAPQTPATPSDKTPSESAGEQTEAVVAESLQPQEISAPIKKPGATQLPLFVTDSGASAIDVLMEIVTTPGAVNGKAKASRVAWKHGDWIFIQLDALLTHASAVTGNMALAKSDKDARSPFLVSLMEDLAGQGVLLTEHAGTRREPRDAIWTVRSAASEAVAAKSTPYQALIVSTSLAPHLPGLEDSKYAPTIVDVSAEEPGQFEQAGDAGREAEMGNLESPEAVVAEEPYDPLAMLDEIDPLTGAPEVAAHTLAEPLPPLPSLPEGYRMASSTVSLTSTKETQRPLNDLPTTSNPAESLMPTHNTKPLTAAILNEKIRAGTTEYGLEIRQVGDKRLAIFDAELIAQAYKFDPENPPEGVKFLAEKGCLIMVAE